VMILLSIIIFIVISIIYYTTKAIFKPSQR
jgi:hypothetical protein